MHDYESLKEGIIAARGDAVWLDVDRLIEEVMDPRTVPSEARRKYLNQIVAAEDAWITSQQWDALANPLLKLRPGDQITLGFDGSRGGDHTALCACRVEDGAIFLLNVWNPKAYDSGKIPTEQVDLAVQRAFERYDVVSFRADVKEFEAYIDKWSADYRKTLKVNACAGNIIAYDMRTKGKKDFLVDCERFENAVIDGEMKHDGNRVLRQHILNARRRPSETYDLVGIGKESRMSDRKIDAAVTAVLAFGARQEYLKSKNNKKKGLSII
jgi:phage terminase large subunit-like protein